MEVESFENEEIAKMLNDWFVSIKVDREERPDVDKVYMTYVSALYGGGGWPLSAFLSPNLKPLMGGTYFPPDDKYGRPGFKTILRKVKEAWETKREMLEKSGTIAIEQLSEALSSTANSSKISDELARVSLKRCSRQLASSYDPKFGGFGTAPKFPRPVEVYILLYESRKLMEEGRQSDANKNVEMVCHTLQCMARGGIHDHIGGGFHRYSVDEHWHVPHFEKMLYDHGQLANAYLDTFSITKDTYYSSVAHDILDYLRRDKIGDAGEIYSAEDADSAEYHGATTKKEGSFYIWTSQEIEEILGEHANLFKDHYYIKPSGNCDLSPMSDPHDEFKGKNVLIERKDAPSMASKWDKSIDEYNQILEECRKKLYDARSKRPRPHLDDKVIVSWNGLAISSFARASKVLKAEPKETQFYFPVMGCDPNEYLEVAEKAVSFIKSKLYDSTIHRLQHSFRNGPSKAPGFLDDYAFLISGLLDLYEFGGRTDWLSWAIELSYGGKSINELQIVKDSSRYAGIAGQGIFLFLLVAHFHVKLLPTTRVVIAKNICKLSDEDSVFNFDSVHRAAQRLSISLCLNLRHKFSHTILMSLARKRLSIPMKRNLVLFIPRHNWSPMNLLTIEFKSEQERETFKRVVKGRSINAGDVTFFRSENCSYNTRARSPRCEDLATCSLSSEIRLGAPRGYPKCRRAKIMQHLRSLRGM
ncbi:hypothetical protein ZIOFF_033822 [Zingiber officinale]|uniref:Spermatogenesis-associated protein 20-like TRX domain-containing protein n=1 Tax=Zingiber officinale TaxID=94328 RepID=A0A8J5L758_ZINOF|nr:hypothetical protein ZIOFF_033822 [Zingiber officinale]